MSSAPVENTGPEEAAGKRDPKRAAMSGWIGSALEYYDFALYSLAAALVFPTVFFPSGNPTIALIASLATYAVGYFIRPIGAVVLGAWGDRHGRKNVLVWAMFLMGASTFLVGVLPTYAQVGALSPILLVVLRMIQGFAVAGELGGASAMIVEHAPDARRGFFASFSLQGTQAGSILATGALLPLAAFLPEEAFHTWGWRIPFLLSAVVMVVGWWIRRTLHESPVFETEQERHEVPKSPLKTLFRTYTPDVIKVVFAALVSVISTLFGIYALTFGASTVGLSRTSLLWMIIIANVIALATIPAWAVVGDRIGRKPVFLIGALGSAALVWPFIWAVSAGNMPLVFVIGILLSGVVYPAYGGVGFALFSEQFGTRVRMSGLAVGTQFGFALGGFAPSIAAVLAGPSLANWVPVAIFGSAASVVATVAALTMRETYRTPLAQLGKPELV